MIDLSKMSLVYPNKKGVFELDLNVEAGQIIGYLGPNGAGKTTTIRALMGFMRPTQGSCFIDGKDCFKEAAAIKKQVGYIPGELTFMEGMNGSEYLDFICDMRKGKEAPLRKDLLERFELSPKGSIKKFSKGTKQKLGIVAAFMHNPDILILDEPTSGLDPLMQNRFIELVEEEKKKGKTILLSSHIFEEVERTCDQVVILKDGRIKEKSSIEALKGSYRKSFVIEAENREALKEALSTAGFEVSLPVTGETVVSMKNEQLNDFIRLISGYTVTKLESKTQTLEDIFLHHYEREDG